MYRTLPTSMESSTATNSSFPAKLLHVTQGLYCAGWNGCSGYFPRCGQYPMDVLRLPLYVNVLLHVKVRGNISSSLWIDVWNQGWYYVIWSDLSNIKGKIVCHFSLPQCSNARVIIWRKNTLCLSSHVSALLKWVICVCLMLIWFPLQLRI